MKKITKKEATQLIEQGFFPVCQTSSRGDYFYVYSLSELQRLEGLSAYQLFVLWGYEKAAIQAFRIPDSAMELTVGDAISLMMEDVPVYVRALGEVQEEAFQGRFQIHDFENVCRKNKLYHRPFLVYWYV